MRILEAVFEADFCNVSYGYRPGRSPHHALRALREQIRMGCVNHVFEADIRGYFNHVCHSWLQRMVRERIADPVILSLIGKWLKAGAMHNGVVIRSEEGTPQGGPISCILANVYLHFSSRRSRYIAGTGLESSSDTMGHASAQWIALMKRPQVGHRQIRDPVGEQHENAPQRSPERSHLVILQLTAKEFTS